MNKFLLILIMVFAFTGCKGQDNSSPRPSTAAPNVSVIDHSFVIPGLDRERLARIYLPEDYDSSNDRYPVLYMHDGQNLFDDSTSYVGEWGVDESLNQLAKENDFKVIVVGIDHGGEKRMTELSPWMNLRFGKGEGKEYMEFIVKHVKPYVDKHYRTLPESKNTAIMGSSMGGLISHYAIYAYPDVFSKAGIFSPSYWYNNKVFTYTENNPVPEDYRMFILIGEKELGAVPMVENMHSLILKTGHPEDNCKLIIDPEGEHNEAFWMNHFMPAVKWLFEL
ncbi:MAG: alpha/beta hydrolase-fold protein [Bacteroidota bacterium]